MLFLHNRLALLWSLSDGLSLLQPKKHCFFPQQILHSFKLTRFQKRSNTKTTFATTACTYITLSCKRWLLLNLAVLSTWLWLKKLGTRSWKMILQPCLLGLGQERIFRTTLWETRVHGRFETKTNRLGLEILISFRNGQQYCDCKVLFYPLW